jgi:pimeloyl-ACP methyl ester carboxylesterase
MWGATLSIALAAAQGGTMMHRVPKILIAYLTLALASSATKTLAQTPPPGRLPAPVVRSLTTKDGVQLKVTYYPSNAGEQAVPVVLLHDYNESRAVMEPLATMLHSPPPELAEDLPPGPAMQARAVLTVDLRGHGESKTAFDDAGGAVELDASGFKLGDFQDMVVYDLEAVRAFLLAENDAGRLNLNELCIVGTGMGANVALTYAARDWAIPPLAARKQGQDVKALALISPRRSFNGLVAADPLKFPPVQRQLSVYFAYGTGDAKIAKECETMVKVFEKYHPAPPREQAATQQDFFVFAPATQRQGSDLLNAPEFALGPRIVEFVEMRLGRIDYPFTVRKR